MKNHLKFMAGKGSYVLGLGIASLVGGLLSAAVLAAVPDSNGVIHTCYDQKGSLRVIDTEAQGTCNKNETPLSWSAQTQSGSSTALAVLNDDGTLDTQHSRGVTNIKLVQYNNDRYTPPQVYRVCFNMANTPSWGTTSGGGVLPVSSSSFASDTDQIAQYCGSGYNAVSYEIGDPAFNPGSSPYSSIRYFFWN